MSRMEVRFPTGVVVKLNGDYPGVRLCSGFARYTRIGVWWRVGALASTCVQSLSSLTLIGLQSILRTLPEDETVQGRNLLATATF